MNQGKNVTLNITTKRSDEEINLITDAVCYAQEGEIRFEYSESLAAKEDTQTVMTIFPDSVIINRVNVAGESTVMLFEEKRPLRARTAPNSAHLTCQYSRPECIRGLTTAG